MYGRSRNCCPQKVTMPSTSPPVSGADISSKPFRSAAIRYTPCLIFIAFGTIITAAFCRRFALSLRSFCMSVSRHLVPVSFFPFQAHRMSRSFCPAHGANSPRINVCSLQAIINRRSLCSVRVSSGSRFLCLLTQPQIPHLLPFRYNSFTTLYQPDLDIRVGD